MSCTTLARMRDPRNLADQVARIAQVAHDGPGPREGGAVRRPTELFVIADDLSGAAETAAVLARPDVAARVVLAGGGRPVPVASGLTVVDLDSRTAAPA